MCMHLTSYAAKPPQFSITHVIFFVQVLYHSLYRMSAFTSWMFFRLEALLISHDMQRLDINDVQIETTPILSLGVHVLMMTCLLSIISP